MSIATSTAKIQYTLASAAQALPVPFYFLEDAHVKVIKAASPADIVLVKGTDYTISGAADEDGGTVTTIAGTAADLDAGDIITIKRDIAITQSVNYVYNDRFPAETHERALDKLTMVAQQLKEATDRCVQFPESEVAGTGNIMPAAAGRAAKILGFDATGNAVQLYDPVSAVFAEGDAIYANSVAALKAVSVTDLLNGQQCHVGGYATPGDKGGGTFVYVSASAATEDVGTVVAPNVGTGRWLRIYSGPINVRWFGAKGDNATDDTASIQAAIDTAGTGDAMTTLRGKAVFIPEGVYLFSVLTLKRGVEVHGETSDLTILRKTSTTSLGLSFDSTGLTPGSVQDRITIKNLSIWQVGTASAGAAISIRGVTSDAQAVIENVLIQNCYVGVATYKTIHSYLKNVLVYYPLAEGFKFTGSAYIMTCTDCASFNGASHGFSMDQGNYSLFDGCAGDHNAGAAFYLSNCLACVVANCGNEQNVYGVSMLSCNGCAVDHLWTTIGATTINAVKLDATSNTILNQIGSATVLATAATYMVASVNSGQYNRLTTGYVATAWPTGISTGNFIQRATDTEYRSLLDHVIQASVTVHSLILSGATFPCINGGASLANQKRIMALYQVGNTFSGIGMDATSIGVRVAGDPSSGVAADIGYYSTDGNYTWTSLAKILTSGRFILSVSVTPASAAAAGVAGTIAWDANYLYVCTATDTWKRVAIATW